MNEDFSNAAAWYRNLLERGENRIRNLMSNGSMSEYQKTTFVIQSKQNKNWEKELAINLLFFLLLKEEPKETSRQMNLF